MTVQQLDYGNFSERSYCYRGHGAHGYEPQKAKPLYGMSADWMFKEADRLERIVEDLRANALRVQHHEQIMLDEYGR